MEHGQLTAFDSTLASCIPTCLELTSSLISVDLKGLHAFSKRSNLLVNVIQITFKILLQFLQALSVVNLTPGKSILVESKLG